MLPIIRVEIFNYALHIPAYRALLILAAAVTMLASFGIAVKKGVPWAKSFTCLIVAAVAGLLGARLLYVLVHDSSYGMGAGGWLRFHLSGMSMYGGLVLAALSGWAVCLALKLDPWKMADYIAPGLGLGIGISKIGCFLNGCCFGKTTNLPWGVVFYPGTEAYKYQILNSARYLFLKTCRLHPVQLYEAAAAIAGALLAWYLLRRRAPDGIVFLALAVWFTAWRWFLLGFRAPELIPPTAQWFYHVLYGSILLICVVIVLWWSRRIFKV